MHTVTIGGVYLISLFEFKMIEVGVHGKDKINWDAIIYDYFYNMYCGGCC